MFASWKSGKSFLTKTLWGIPVVVTFRDCLFCPEFIEGRSMQPTLNPSPERGRDLALVFKFGVLRYKYERGAIYLLRSPEHPRKLLTKRLIGVEGDWVSIPGEASIQRIQKGFCWVEGDNDLDNEDSRSKFGQVPISLLEGKIVSILWPPDRICRIPSELPPERLLITNSNAFRNS